MTWVISASRRRLFAADRVLARATQEKMSRIAAVCDGWQDGVGMPQGYTYLGQLLAHDLVSREQPREPTSVRSRRLDFDSMYGADAPLDDTGMFRYSPLSESLAMDLLRDERFVALIPEFRNDEHPIISQLHLTVELFHNATLTHIRRSTAGRGLSAERQFDAAKQYVVATLQRIYDEEYLCVCSDPLIYAQYRSRQLRVFDIPASEEQLPYEITHAALRFGHAQVRRAYRLNESPAETTLPELFELRGLHGGGSFRGVPRDKRVDWRRFFPWEKELRRGIVCVSGQRINPKIVAEMSRLSEPPEASILVRNIEAGIRTELASGQAIAELVARIHPAGNVVPRIQLQRSDRKQHAILAEHGLLDATPLWLFLLIEAAAQGEDGMYLGPLGSIFLCETLRSALEGQPSYSIVQAQCRKQFGLKQIGTFQELARFADPALYDTP